MENWNFSLSTNLLFVKSGLEEDIISVPALQLINSIWNPVVSSRGFWTIVCSQNGCSDGPICIFFAQILYIFVCRQGKIGKIYMWCVFIEITLYLNLIMIKTFLKKRKYWLQQLQFTFFYSIMTRFILHIKSCTY